jgi:hypothetical protein
MRMKKETKMTGSVIVAVVALCLLNVAAASPIAATAAPYNKIETGAGKDATVGLAFYHLELFAPSHTASVNVPFPLEGTLLGGFQGVSRAKIYVQSSTDPGGPWTNVTTWTTALHGDYGGTITAQTTGQQYFQTVYYDSSGNATYSKVVEVTVS